MCVPYSPTICLEDINLVIPDGQEFGLVAFDPFHDQLDIAFLDHSPSPDHLRVILSSKDEILSYKGSVMSVFMDEVSMLSFMPLGLSQVSCEPVLTKI